LISFTPSTTVKHRGVWQNTPKGGPNRRERVVEPQQRQLLFLSRVKPRRGRPPKKGGCPPKKVNSSPPKANYWPPPEPLFPKTLFLGAGKKPLFKPLRDFGSPPLFRPQNWGAKPCPQKG